MELFIQNLACDLESFRDETICGSEMFRMEIADAVAATINWANQRYTVPLRGARISKFHGCGYIAKIKSYVFP